MFDSNGKLRIFENFIEDRSLPKFRAKLKKGEQDSKKIMAGRDLDPDEDLMADGEEPDMELASIRILQSPDASGIRLGPPSRSIQRWDRLCFWRKPKSSPVLEMTVEDFFHSVKDSVAELSVVDGRARGYEAAIAKAVKAGQVAFVEHLQQNLVAVRSEAQLAAIGLAKYIEEEVLVAFARKSSRALKLDWIRNFVRPIPDLLLIRKLDLDERLIFDNYVVLHYDPSGRGRADTEKEKAKRRDPILFGVLRGRRRLYHVGDWQDEFCDLTLDQVADAMGKESIGVL